MPYRRIRIAFLFQSIVSLISLVSVLMMGRTGLVMIALLFFRPFILERGPGSPGDTVRRLYGRIFRVSAVATSVFLILLFAARESGMPGATDDILLLLLILPSAMLIHGITGYLLAREE